MLSKRDKIKMCSINKKINVDERPAHKIISKREIKRQIKSKNKNKYNILIIIAQIIVVIYLLLDIILKLIHNS